MVTGNFDAGSISLYSIDEELGNLAHIEDLLTNGNPTSFAVNANGNTVYLASQSDLSTYSINLQTGRLVRVGGSLGGQYVSVSTDAFSKFTYAVDMGYDLIQPYSIKNQIGLLGGRYVGETEFTIELTRTEQIGSRGMTLHPSGNYAYVANSGSNNVSSFRIDRLSGRLAELAPPIKVGPVPNGIHIHPTGKFAYTPNVNNGTISILNINQDTGILSTPVSNTVTAGIDPVAITFDPTGSFAYSVNAGSDNITTFVVNTVTGELTRLDFDTQTGFVPLSLEFTMSGKLAFVANYGSSDITIYNVTSDTGKLVKLRTVSGRLGNAPIAIIHSF
jgi:6-phosphogluconolactonase (cycloisomerase 2 family)